MNYDVIRSCANEVYRHARNDDGRLPASMIKFYEYGKESPSVANLIMRDEILKSVKNYAGECNGSVKEYVNKSITAIKNLGIVDKLPQVRPALHEYAESFRTLYPETEFLRQKLINTDRVIFDSVQPKANWFTKLRLAKFIK